MTFQESILQSAEEGSVLLRNEKDTLPVLKSEKLAVFGRVQFDYYRSGQGSGGSVHVPYYTTLIEELLSLEKKGEGPVIDKKVMKAYEEWRKENPFDNGGGGWAAEPWSQKEMPLDDKLAEEASRQNDKAIFILGRTAGEDKDMIAEKGSWFLTDTERQALKTICAHFEKVAVLFNTSGIMDMSWIDDEDFKGHITCLMYVWQGGMEGGRQAARLVSGLAVPSGKLSDTIAKDINDYPSTKNFGSDVKNVYQEDIYVGYRYFSTFAKDKILFPFGFGLSYTKFETRIISASFDDKKVTIHAVVKNNGSTYSGKEVLQIYVEAPQGKLGKAKRVLAGFKKTDMIEPGFTRQVSVSFSLNDIASYDETGATDFKSSYVLEKGLYKIFAGNSSASCQEVQFEKDGNLLQGIELKETLCVEKLEQALAPEENFKRLRTGKEKSDGTFEEEYEDVPLNEVDLEKRIKENLPPDIPFTGDKGIRFAEVKIDNSKMDAFIAQLPPEELAIMVRGEGMMSQKVTVGIAAAYGGIDDTLHSFGIPCAGCSDGPSGIRLDTGKEASLMPIGTQLACTWNPELIEVMFTFEGQELLKLEIDSLLGPGMNIHRNPLNGRNFEYLSEDPYLTGTIVCSIIRGLHEGGSSGTIKHFAANNQERARNAADSVVSERALREIYLKAFEIAVKKSPLVSLMTSYNPINGHWAASNYDLISTILKKEWNYKGLVMTDWWAKMNHCTKGGEATVKNVAYMIRAGNDVYMVVNNDGAQINEYGDNTLECLKNGEITLGELQQCCKNILRFIIQAPVTLRPLRPLKIVKELESSISSVPEGETIAEEGEGFLPEKGKCVYLKAEHDAMYNIQGVYTKGGDDLSQSVVNILIDGNQVASLECRSTAGILTTVNAAQVHLTKGFYKVELEYTKPGITVERISLSSKVDTPVTMGYIK